MELSRLRELLDSGAARDYGHPLTSITEEQNA